MSLWHLFLLSGVYDSTKSYFCSAKEQTQISIYMEKVFILTAVRTPIGSFGGGLSKFTAPQLGSIAIKGALDKGGINPEQVEEVFMGNVLTAGVGQAPARQAALGAGIPNTVPCTTVNKVCASGMKSIMFGAQSIMLGFNDIVIAGGMESMSNAPYLVPKARWGYKYGNGALIDVIVNDGLEDAYSHQVMGVFADETAKEMNISRERQDAFSIRSYRRSAEATQSGAFKEEIIPVVVPQRKGDPITISEDEEYKRVKFDKVPQLRPAFTKDGTVTAANASTLNDGASALILISERKMNELGLNPLARLVSFADAAHEPGRFTTAPVPASEIALQRAGLTKEDVDFYEVNEAFAVVTLAFLDKLDIAEDKVNVHGGACSLGHPLGASGARIIATLAHTLRQKNSKYGLATLCNGGGGASALIIENTAE